MSETLKQLAIKGSLWTLGSYGASQAIRLGSNLILTRLLFPEVFGLMALVSVFTQGLNMVSDVGIGPSIIQNKKGDEPDFYNTAWTLQIIRGLILWLVACCFAWPVSRFYDEQLLLTILPVSALSIVISGFRSTKYYTANRHLALGYISIIELITQTIRVVVMVILAWQYRSVWALVIGGLVGAIIGTTLSHFVLPGGKNRLVWNRSAIMEIIDFGKWIFLSSILNYFAMHGDKLILGKLFTKSELGVYVIAVFVIEAQINLVSRLAGSVIFPAFSQVARKEPQKLREVIYKTRRPLDWFTMIMAGIMITCGSQIIEILYDDRYLQAGWMLQIFGIRLIFGPTSKIYMQALVAIGKPYYDVVITVARVLCLFIGLPLAYAGHGIEGGVWAILFSFVIPYPLVAFSMARNSLLSISNEFWCLVPLGFGFTLGGLLYLLVSVL